MPAQEEVQFMIAPPGWVNSSSYLYPTSVTFRETVNKGVSATFRLDAGVVSQFLPLASLLNFNTTYTEEQVWYIVARRAETDSSSDTSSYTSFYNWTGWISPPLVVGRFTPVWGTNGAYLDCIATDISSFRATMSGVTLPTFQDHVVSDLLASLASTARWNSITVNGPSSGTKIREFEVQGDPLGSSIARVARDFALDMQWTWSRGGTPVDPSSGLETALHVTFMDPSTTDTRASTYASIGYPDGIWTEAVNYSFDMSKRYHRLYLQKTSKTPGLYQIPIDKFGYFTADLSGGLISSTIQIKDLSQVGSIGYVAGYALAGHQGDNTFLSATGQYAGSALGLTTVAGNVFSITGSLDPPTTGNTSFSQANGYLVLMGTPAEFASYDGNFELVYPLININNPWQLARERRLVITSPLWDTKISTNTNYIQYLYRLGNKGVCTVVRKVRFNPMLPAGYWYQNTSMVVPGAGQSDPMPSARYDSIEWSWQSGSAPSMTMHGWIPVV